MEFRSNIVVVIAMLVLIAGCTPAVSNPLVLAPSATDDQSATLFQEVDDVIPFEDRLRRKWDSPVIADLDQNGYQDVIITEHGNSLKIFWNEGGTFSGPQRISGGDQHGVAAADYDRDGRIDVIVSQGGGDGANPKKAFQRSISRNRRLSERTMFDYFEKGRGRATKFIDPNQDGILDLYLTGFPLPSQKGGANHLYRNVGDGKFDFVGLLPQAKWLGYRSIITDFNGDADDDILFFGGDNIVAAQGGEGFQFSNVNKTVLSDLANVSDVSNIIEIDYDNDGDFDLFLTRAEAQFDIETYYDREKKRFAFLTFRKKFRFEDMKIEGDLHIENLQMTYPHFDVFVGGNKRKQTFDIERHGNREIRLKPEEAMGWPEGPTDAGFYIGYLGDGIWRFGGESRSRLAAVVNGVISRPASTPQVPLPAKLYENRDGVFVDATERLGIAINEQTTGAVAGDFNNDGFTDLAVLRYGNMATHNEQIVLLNQGGTSFERAANHGIHSRDVGTTGGAIEVFDYDLNGKLDLIYSDERGRWHLLRNMFSQSKESNFVIVTVGDSPNRNRAAMGAELTAKACGQIYKRRVGSGSAAFSQGANNDLHIGLGSCDKISSAIVRWTNGETEAVQFDGLNSRYFVGKNETN